MIKLTATQNNIENALKARNLSDLELTVYSKYQCGADVSEIATALEIAENEIYDILRSAALKFPKGTGRPFNY